MWHVSISSKNTVTNRYHDDVPMRRLLRQVAAEALAGVGSDAGEWWYWNRLVHVGHLRVPTTEDEVDVCGLGNPTIDAGPEGTWTKGRTYST